MKVEVTISNGKTPLVDVLKQHLKSADTFKVATAYLNAGGLDRIMDCLRAVLKRGGSISVLHGVYINVTEPCAIGKLLQLKADFRQSMSYYVYVDEEMSFGTPFHPKMYISGERKSVKAVIGSSNLTFSGLSKNTELNCILSGKETESPIKQAQELYESFTKMPAVMEPDNEWLLKYEAAYKKAREAKKAAPTGDLDSIYEELAAPSQRSWVPENQEECVIKALQNLEASEGQNSIHYLRQITREAQQIAHGLDKGYKESSFPDEIRAYLSENTGRGKKVFERVKRAHYKLTKEGSQYTGKR